MHALLCIGILLPGVLLPGLVVVCCRGILILVMLFALCLLSGI